MANSVTARFNDDCKVFVSMSDDTTVEKAVIIDAEGNETDIGGGGGSSDFSTAEVTFINNDDNEPIPLPKIPVIQNNVLTAITPDIDTQLILTIPLYKGKLVLFEFGDPSDNGIWSDQAKFITTGITNITGNCQNTLDWDNCNGSFLITGDCVITITDYSK